MKVLVTAGGTSEKIDQVRRITNMSTGQLGSLIADAFIDIGADVTYVCGRSSARPRQTTATLHIIDTVGELLGTLRELLKSQRYDAVIHSMAVSDYTISGSSTAEALAEAVAKHLLQGGAVPMEQSLLASTVREAVLDSEAQPEEKKISSNLDNMLLYLKRTPKVIGIFKELQPGATLIGFKLLVSVDEDTLIQTGKGLLQKNKCDYVLANDLENIRGQEHKAVLIGADGSLRHMRTKEEIAQVIAGTVTEKRRLKEKWEM